MSLAPRLLASRRGAEASSHASRRQDRVIYRRKEEAMHWKSAYWCLSINHGHLTFEGSTESDPRPTTDTAPQVGVRNTSDSILVALVV
eukprot:scaffold311751_cov26-Tisochrysis_lutea.AAC.1